MARPKKTFREAAVFGFWRAVRLWGTCVVTLVVCSHVIPGRLYMVPMFR